MLKRDKHRAYSKKKKMVIEKKIAETERELKESGIKEKMENERRAIDSMQEYPKMFYTYVNNQKNRRREIGPLKNSKGELSILRNLVKEMRVAVKDCLMNTAVKIFMTLKLEEKGLRMR